MFYVGYNGRQVELIGLWRWHSSAPGPERFDPAGPAWAKLAVTVGRGGLLWCIP